MCAMRSAFLVPIQMWKSTFMSWSFMSVLTSASISMIRSSLQRKQKGWIGKHRNCRNVHEGNCHLGFTTANFPLFRIPKNFSIFWFVCSDHALAVSALAFCFQQSLLLGFSGISTLSSIESVSLVKRNMARKHACFVNIFVS